MSNQAPRLERVTLHAPLDDARGAVEDQRAMLAMIKLTARRLPGMQFLAVQRQKLALARLEQAPCNTAPLAADIDRHTLKTIFSSQQIDREWPDVEREIAALGTTDKAGGVNPGDRRAIYYLVRYFHPRSILEIGTHIGASTVHAAAALRANQSEDPTNPYRLTTVDIIDVNDARSRPWIRHGSTYSPWEMVTRIGVANRVTFVTARSLAYFSSSDIRYDFVFLDGDHSATAVYQEVTTALRVLNPGGVILMHDYFPRLHPLWSDSSVIPGPWLGTQRLKTEGAKIDVLPLGDLPWGTKLNSTVTSLALLVGQP
jgi:predicted O-methyltransferase YrrM